MEEEAQEKVYLYCYDISQGLAKQLSPMLIGQQVDAIYHTGLVVFNREYFFGNGIWYENAGATPFGQPIEKKELGETQVTQELFHDFLEEIKDRFTFMTYNVVTCNWNHFTNEWANFLVGEDIPSEILNQAKDFFDTPLGKSIQPMVVASQDALKQGSHSMFDTGSAEGTNQTPQLNPASAVNAFSNIQMGSAAVSQLSSVKLIEVTDITLLQEKIITTPLLVLYFWSPVSEEWKDPNGVISALADEHASASTQFVAINTQTMAEIALNFDIKKIPAVYIYKYSDVLGTYAGEEITEEVVKGHISE